VPRSIKKPRESHIASVEGTFSLLLAAKEKRVRRVVYAGSSSAYGNQPAPSKSEEMRPDPLSPYAVAKLVGEYYCKVFSRVYELETVTLRYFNVFGPRQDPSSLYSGVVSRFISALLSGQQPVIYGDGEHSRDFTYIDNVVAANLSAAEAKDVSGKVINVANGKSITLNQLLAELKDLTGKHDVEPLYEPERLGDVRSSLADITLARELLAYESKVDLREGLQRTIDWWKSSRFSHR
jgi:nucleoside-diphosphate-sugar epimerase